MQNIELISIQCQFIGDKIQTGTQRNILHFNIFLGPQQPFTQNI